MSRTFNKVTFLSNSMYLPEYFMRPAKQKKLKQKSIIVHLPSDSVVSTFIDL